MQIKSDMNKYEEITLPITLKGSHSVGWYQIDFV